VKLDEEAVQPVQVAWDGNEDVLHGNFQVQDVLLPLFVYHFVVLNGSQSMSKLRRIEICMGLS
jgi:hypothetical protein